MLGLARDASVVLGTAAVVLAAYLAGRGITPGHDEIYILAALSVVAYRMAVSDRAGRFFAIGAMAGIAVVGVNHLARAAIEGSSPSRTWDFVVFYLDGNVGGRGQNFYRPESYAETFEALDLTVADPEGFVTEIVDVGFKYPPMTMFLFSWMEGVPAERARVLWQALVCASFLVAAWVLARHLLPHGTLLVRLLAATVLISTLPASASNMTFAQTNALILALGVLSLAADPRGRAGLFSALAVSVKPIMAFSAAYHVLRGRWRALAICVAAVIALFGAAAVAYGPGTVLDYVRANPVGRVPSWLFTEWVNQSLLSTLLRLSSVEVPSAQAVWYPPFLLIGGAVGLLSLWLAWQLARRGDALAFGLFAATGLLLYPGVLKPYGMLMLIPLLQLGGRLWRTPQGTGFLALLVGVTYWLDSLIPFAAHALVWAVTCLWAVCADRLEPLLAPRPTR